MCTRGAAQFEARAKSCTMRISHRSPTRVVFSILLATKLKRQASGCQASRYSVFLVRENSNNSVDSERDNESLDYSGAGNSASTAFAKKLPTESLSEQRSSFLVSPFDGSRTVKKHRKAVLGGHVADHYESVSLDRHNEFKVLETSKNEPWFCLVLNAGIP